MRRMPAVLRCVLFALATLQSGSGAVLAVVDGLSRSRELALPAHAEDQGASHKARGHSHDCIACRELRSGHALLLAPHAQHALELKGGVAAREAVIVTNRTAHSCCARSPPVRIG